MQETIKEKQCGRCHSVKPIEQFALMYNNKTWRTSRCKTCACEISKQWRKEHPNFSKERWAKDKTEILEWRRKNRNEKPKQYLLRKIRSHAKDRNILCDLTLHDIPDIPELCPVLGIKLEFGNGQPTWNSPSIDRVDSGFPYTKTNIRIISHRANTLKSNATVAEIEAVVRYMELNNCK